MFSKLGIFFCVHIIIGSNSVSVPFIKKCVLRNDACVLSSTRAAISDVTSGIPEFNMAPVDPFELNFLNFTTRDLNLIFTDIVARGVKNCHVEKISASESAISGRGICVINIEGKYDVDGSILFVPIKGKGNFRIKLDKLAVDANLKMDTVAGKDGKKHWKINNFSYTYEILGKSEIKLDNLFDGNKALSRAINEVLDNNANEVILEVAPPVVDELATRLIKSLKNFFSHVPLKDLIANEV